MSDNKKGDNKKGEIKKVENTDIADSPPEVPKTVAPKKKKGLLDQFENVILVVGFAIMFGSIFFANEFRPIVAGAVDVIISPITSTMPFFIVVLAIAAIVTVMSTFIQKYTMDWELMRRVTEKNRILQKKMREAQLSGNKAMVKKLQDEQLAGMDEQAQLSKQQLKPMGFLMIISVPLFFWAFWWLTQPAHSNLTMIFPFWGEKRLLDGIFIFQYWIVWSIMCSFTIGQVVRKALNVGISA